MTGSMIQINLNSLFWNIGKVLDREDEDKVDDGEIDDDDDEKVDGDRNSGVLDRLGLSIHERLGRRNNQDDVRDEIEQSRRRRKNIRTYGSDDGYEDEDGIFHDIYQADGVKTEVEDDKQHITRHENEATRSEETSRSRSNNESNRTHRISTKNSSSSSSNIKKRLGDVETTVPDLRDKLRQKEKKISELDKEIKEEKAEKLNLCIEIKQEVANDDDINMEEDLANFEF